MRKNISVNMVNTRSVKEHKTKEKAMEELNVPEYWRGGKENHGINTNANSRRTRKENDRALTE